MISPSLIDIYRRHEAPNHDGPQIAADCLREAIVTGVLSGGAAIRQDDVARILQTSKAPLREALRQLVSEGLVTFIMNRGFFVSEMSKAEMEESFLIRAELEPLAIELAMPMMTKTSIDLAEQYLHSMETVRDSSWLCRLNLQFHCALYKPSGALHLLNMIEHVHYVSHRYVHARYSRYLELPLSQDEHRGILAACVARNTPRAKFLVQEHILGALESLKTDLEPLLRERGQQDGGRGSKPTARAVARKSPDTAEASGKSRGATR